MKSNLLLRSGIILLIFSNKISLFSSFFFHLVGIRLLPVTTRNASSLISSFESSIAKIPIREAVRYTKKNMKWTADEFRVRRVGLYTFINICINEGKCKCSGVNILIFLEYISLMKLLQI